MQRETVGIRDVIYEDVGERDRRSSWKGLSSADLTRAIEKLYEAQDQLRKIDFHTGSEEVYLVDQFPALKFDQEDWAHVRLTRPVMANKTHAILAVDFSCGMLCGGGTIVVLERVDGKWSVVDRHTYWVS